MARWQLLLRKRLTRPYPTGALPPLADPAAKALKRLRVCGCLDTTVFIELERAMRGLPAERAMTEVTQHLASQLGENEVVAIAAITASELLHAVHGATEEHGARRAAFVEAVIAAFPTLSFDLLVARVHARLWAGLASSGTEVGAHDRLVAATAMSAGWRVGTANIHHFNRIPGPDVASLQMRQPTIDPRP